MIKKENTKKDTLVSQSDTLVSSQEAIPTKPRFLIFGSRISGAYGTADAFEKHLAALGFEAAQVDAVRDAAYIDDAFYNISQAADSLELEPSKPSGVLRRLGNLILRREVATSPDDAGKDLPQGVVVFPQMRQYTSSGSGMFIHSPRDYIQDLCDKNQVPVIFIEDLHSEAELANSVSAFTVGPKQVTQ